MAQVCTFLPDSRQRIFRGIIALKHLGNGVVFLKGILSEMGQWNGREFLWRIFIVVNERLESSEPYIFHIIGELPVEMGKHIQRKVFGGHMGFQSGKPADFLGRHRADSCEAGIDGFAKRRRLIP